jgi:6-phosphogluconolactonase
MNVITTESDADFDQKGCAFIADAILAAIAERTFAIVGLSGGSTPRGIYDLLGQDDRIDWSRVWLFLVDDRYCAADSPKSNQFLLRMSLLRHAPIPESQLLFPRTELDRDACIDEYDAVMDDLLKKGQPDLVVLGMGDDGHIASLFSPVPAEASGPHHVIATTTETFDIRERISVTFPVLCAARQAVFFLKGKEKLRVWQNMQSSGDDFHRWPAKKICTDVPTTIISV